MGVKSKPWDEYVGANAKTQKKFYALTLPQRIAMIVPVAIRRTLMETEDGKLTNLHLRIILAAKEMQSHHEWFDRPTILKLFKRLRQDPEEGRFYRRFKELLQWGYFVEVSLRKRAYSSVKFNTTMKCAFFLRRLSTHMNKLVGEDLWK